jgi:UDP-N-acetylmuramoylalanine--D-glutamate ligase
VVASAGGVLWVNDSKATNPHAASASLSAFSSVVWVAGGLSKGVNYDALVTAHAARLKAVVLIGAESTALQAALDRHAPDVPVITGPTSHTGNGQPGPGAAGDSVMEWAVAEADRIAADGDTVLLAPAAASMDQFSSYAHRGDAFAAAVRALVEGPAETAKEF